MKKWEAEEGYRPLADHGYGRDLIAKASDHLAVASVDFGRPDDQRADLYLQADAGGATAAYTVDEAWGLSIMLPRVGYPTVTVRLPNDPATYEMPLDRALEILRAAARVG